MKTKFFLCLYIVGISLVSPAENTALSSLTIPAVSNFTKNVYRAATQNWAVAQDNRGFMYFANNDGVLEYDGTTWNLYQFSDPVLTRSLTTDEKGTLYIGMFNDFGSVQPDSNGKMVFKSFRNQLPDSLHDIGEVWKIHSTPEGIFFQTYSQLMLFDRSGNLKQLFTSPGNYRFSFFQNNKLYIQEIGKGLLEFTQNRLSLVPGLEKLVNLEIWSLLSTKSGTLIIGTSQNGVFILRNGELDPWSNPTNDLLKKNQIFSACRIDNTYIAFGTIQDGVYVVTEAGNVIQHLNKRNGLQNNTILSMATDNTGNLWLGLDNGIDYLEINSPVSFLYHPEGFGAGYSVAIHNGFLYLGTNNGLFAAPWKHETTNDPVEFALIKNTVGQIWHLGVYDGILLCGHDNGTYQVDGMNARKISDVKGAWKFLTLSGHPGILIGGTYEGLTLFAKDKPGGSWQFRTKIKGFSESCRIMEEDEDGKIWMTHGFKGVFRIFLNERCDGVLRSDYYGNQSGFITNKYINVFKIDRKPVFTSREGIFRYSATSDRFEKDTLLEKVFNPNKNITYLRQDNTGNIWFVADGKPGVVRNHDGIFSLVVAPFEILHHQMVAGFENIFPYSDNEIFICLENGFAHYSPNATMIRKNSFITYIRKIEVLHTNTVILGGERILNFDSKTTRIPEFKYKKNSIRFTFSSPRYQGKREIEYSHLLSEYETEWSGWSPMAFCQFSNLHEGNYTLQVRARDSVGHISESDNFSFRIQPPWYRSNFAYVVYILLAVFLILLLIWFILKRIEISKRRERLKHLKEYRAKEQQYQHEALLAEKEIINLKNEKLQSEMIHRDKELANQTLNLLQKNKFLLKIKEELRKLDSHFRDEGMKAKLNQLIKRIDKDIDNEKQWALFESAFDEVHEDFMKRIKEQFPDLTPRDIRLCAYLRMNISSKEIAALMNISTRGIEISRYRLRKKFNIDRDTNLSKFIIEF